MPDRLPNISEGLRSCALRCVAHPRPTYPSRSPVPRRGIESASDSSLIALLDEGVPVGAHTPLPSNTRPGAAATRSAGFLPISLLRFSPLATRESVVSLTTQLPPSLMVWWADVEGGHHGGHVYGYAFQDKTRRATTPASRATSPGSGDEAGPAERDGESRRFTAGLTRRRRPPPVRQVARRSWL